MTRPHAPMRKSDAHLPTLTRLGGPLRTEGLLVLRGKHVTVNAVDQRCGRETTFGKYRIPFLNVLMQARQDHRAVVCILVV